MLPAAKNTARNCSVAVRRRAAGTRLPGQATEWPEWLTCFLDQLYRLLVHTDHRLRWIVRFFVRFKHIFHMRDKLSVTFGRDHSVLDISIGHAIFFSV